MWIIVIGQVYSLFEEEMVCIAQIVCKITHVWMVIVPVKLCSLARQKMAMRFRSLTES